MRGALQLVTTLVLGSVSACAISLEPAGAGDGGTVADVADDVGDASRATTDAPATDAPATSVCGDAGSSCELACVPTPAMPSNNYQGIGITSEFWTGWRFEVTGTSSAQLHRVGFNQMPNALNSTTRLFAAIVAIDGPYGTPSPLDLSGTDVLARTVFTVPAQINFDPVTVTADLSATLAPGWYAVMFGAGAFGADSQGAIGIGNPNYDQCTNGQFPFSIRRSDGSVIPQGEGLYVFVDLTTP